MQILSIHLKNIKSHRELDLEFSPGINVLSGPNGVGKSTVFEAIGYALFGVDAQNFVGNIERFVSIGAKKGEVSVVFQVDDERFRVSRTVGTPARWLLAREMGGGFEVEEHKDIRETEGRLKELLGLDNGRSLGEQFELVIGPFQNEFLGPFVEKRPATRRNRFDEILGIDSWRKTFDKTSILLKAVQNRIAVLESAIEPLREQAATLPEKREKHRQAKHALSQCEQEFAKQQQVLEGMDVRLKEIDRREALVKDLGVQIDRLKERIDNGNEMIGSQKALIDEAEKARKIVAESRAGKLACEEAERRLGELRERVTIQRKLEQEAAILDKRVSTLAERHASESRAIEQAARDLRTEEQSLAEKGRTLAVDENLRQVAARLSETRESIKELRAQLGQLEGRRAGLEEGSEKLAEGSCPFFQEPCRNIAESPPGDLFSSRLAGLATERDTLVSELERLEKQEGESVTASDRIKKIEVQLKGVEEQALSLAARRKRNEERSAGLEDLQKEQAAAQQELSGKQKILDTYSSLHGEINAVEAEQKKHQAARDLYVANQEQAARLEERQAGLQKFEDLLTRLQGELTARAAELAAASKEYDPSRHEALREQKDALRQEVGALGQKVEGLRTDVARMAEEIEGLKRIEQEIAAKQARIKACGEREELVRFLRNRVFRKVSGYLSERFREEISQRANRIYRIIAEVDEELAWGEDYRIVLRDLAEGALRERADAQLSGGQTMSAVVALRLALLQTIGARVAFFDEPTSNLDAARRENLAHAFRAIDVGKEEVTEHWYDQLFLISHDVAFTEVTDQMLELGE